MKGNDLITVRAVRLLIAESFGFPREECMMRAEVMEHLRERPLLPPWWTQEMLDAAAWQATEWCKTFLDADEGERGSR
jgi:hypothetical protein